MLTIGSLFSGIGGLELGLERSGLGPVVWQVEIDPFCRRVLAKHWPEVQRYEDVRTANPEPVDLVCGGFPCQNLSSAGKGEGLTGSRSGLWFEFARIVDELRPQWVVVENVASGATRWVDQVCAHLGQLDYAALPIPLSAQDVGAPHIRRRVFIVAHTDRFQLRQQQGRRGGARGQGTLQPAVDGKQGAAAWAPGWPPVPDLRRVDDGFPHRMDRNNRLKALGNAVVPQCAEVIGHVVRALHQGSV